MNADDAPEPDWEELGKLQEETERLAAKGELDRAAFVRIHARAVVAVKDVQANGDLLEFIENEAKQEWLDDV